MSRKKEQLKNVFIGHSKILLWDLINKESMTLEEAIVALKYLLYDDEDLKSTKWKAKRVDEAVSELAAIGLLNQIKDLKTKWTNEDGTPVTLEDYRNWLSNENKESKEAEAEASNKNEPNKADKKQLRQNAAALRDKLKPYTNAIKKLEKQMETLQEKLAKLEEELADPELYQTGGDKLKTLLKQQGELRSQLAETEEEWFIKSDELEALNAEVQ